MIVDPDFLEHWKTRMLVDMLGDESAPLFVIRLWGHCQNRREWVFDGMPIHATKAICRYQGEAQDLEDALIACGFLEREGKEITVVGWDEHNASLIANWKNGSRGGRPRKNPKEPEEKPMGLPSDNPSVSDKIGLDKIGSDKKDIPPKSPKGDSVNYDSWPELPDPQILKDWIAARKKAKATHSQTAINNIGKELHKAKEKGFSVNECLSEAVTRGWRGLKAEWMQNAQGQRFNGNGQPAISYDQNDTSWADDFNPNGGDFDGLV